VLDAALWIQELSGFDNGRYTGTEENPNLINSTAINALPLALKFGAHTNATKSPCKPLGKNDGIIDPEFSKQTARLHPRSLMMFPNSSKRPWANKQTKAPSSRTP